MHYDFILLFPVLFLVGIGVVMVYSSSSALAMKRFGSDYFFSRKQLSFALMGIAALVTFRHIPLSWIRKSAYPLLVLAFFLLCLIFVSEFRFTAGGASRWLKFGRLTFQPSEVTRFAMILYLAYSLSKKAPNIQEFSIGFLPHVLVLSIFSVLILLQPDFGSVVILNIVTWAMMFTAGVRLKHLLGSLAVILPTAGYLLFKAAYRVDRLLSFRDPWKYASEGGYQIIHSLMAFGSGGIWGTGIGKGYQKLFYLPEPHTDFIFSVVGEELGLMGVLFILGLYALVIWRGLRIARHAEDRFASFLAFGLTTALGLQICINLGVSMALLPTKGLTLPFLSYGGTSLLLNMVAIGILMNIGASKRA